MNKGSGKGRQESKILVMSGINFPNGSRSYLLNLCKEIAEQEKVNFVVVAGNTLAGKELESELNIRTKYALQGVKADEREDVRYEVRDTFVAEYADALEKFIPKMNDISYHIVVAEKVYDKPVGREILERLQRLRQNDIRVYTDPETKIPIHLPGFGYMRVIVPRKAPWFYENVTGLVQRVAEAFSMKTFSNDPPGLIIGGCTGVAAYIPFYNSIPLVAAPVLHKIDNPKSTENMVGCTLITISEYEDYPVVKTRFYNFRKIISDEKELSIPKNITPSKRLVLEALKPGNAALSGIRFRINHEGKKEIRSWDEKRTAKVVVDLVTENMLSFDRKSNQYSFNKKLEEQVSVSLKQFLEGSRVIRQLTDACPHFGALKTLYATIQRDEIALSVWDPDIVLVTDGDQTQGISHNYEYNGEVVAAMNGADKHELLAAEIRNTILSKVFKGRWELAGGKKCFSGAEEVVKKFLPRYVYRHGNHDEPRFSHSKNSIPLALFDERLRRILPLSVAGILAEKKIKIDTLLLNSIVDEKIERVGESRCFYNDGVKIGLKHPYQPRTKSKGTRVQETIKFYRNRDLFDKTYNLEHDLFVKAYDSVRYEVRKEKRKGVNAANTTGVIVANFHEACFIVMSFLGKTLFGVMVAAQVLDTEFEDNQNKTVQHGVALSATCVDSDNNLLWTEAAYYQGVAKEDREIVLADKITTQDVARLSLRLPTLPWR